MTEPLVIDKEGQGIIINGNIVRPPSAPFRLIYALASGRRNKVWSRSELLDDLNRTLQSDDRTIDWLVYKARRFLYANTGRKWICTRYAEGYAWEGPVQIVRQEKAPPAQASGAKRRDPWADC